MLMRHGVWRRSGRRVWHCVTLIESVIWAHGHSCFSFRHCTIAGHTGVCTTGSISGGGTESKPKETNSPRIPSIIFFGGDIVSLVALKALHERIQSIATASCSSSAAGCSLNQPPCRSCNWARSHLAVVCPFLPTDPITVSKHYRRQYPVARYCIQHGIPLLPVDHPTSLARSSTMRRLLHPCGVIGEPRESEMGVGFDEYFAGQTLEAFDVAVVVSFRYFIPNSLLERLPRTINLHPSLLPRYRGASPIFAPLLCGDSVGGASLIKLLPRQRLMDSGDVLWQQSFPIPYNMSIREYFPLVTRLGTAGLCESLFGFPPALRPDGECKQENSVVNEVTNSSGSTACDWPQTFNARWDSAWPQGHDVHFREDPYHAPLLPKNRAVIRWHTMTAEEAHGTWRAFVGGEYFSPTVNATLDKGATPLCEQLLKRLLVHEVRQAEKRSSCQCIKHPGEREEDSRLRLLTPHKGEVKSANAAGDVVVVTPENYPNLRQKLLVGCTFTDALHLKEVPSAVLQELKLLSGGDGSGIQLEMLANRLPHNNNDNNSNKSHHLEGCIEPGSGYFPKAAGGMCAVKCRIGWFVWKAAALQGSTSQPADLLRKGMAMKIGVLYSSLFVDNDGKREDVGAHGD